MPPELHIDGAPWDWQAVHRVCLRTTRRVLRCDAAAEDAAQEAMLLIWRHQMSCRTPERPWGWIAAIAHREAVRATRQPSPEVLNDADAPAAPWDESEHLGQLDLHRALAQLAPAERALLAARYWADLTQEQVAHQLGLPAGTVKVRLHRLRARLRPLLIES